MPDKVEAALTETALVSCPGPQTVHENLRMSSAMLSRFDLVFLLLDRPDEALDHSLSEHVLALHSGKPAGLGAIRPICHGSHTLYRRLQCHALSHFLLCKLSLLHQTLDVCYGSFLQT